MTKINPIQLGRKTTTGIVAGFRLGDMALGIDPDLDTYFDWLKGKYFYLSERRKIIDSTAYEVVDNLPRLSEPHEQERSEA